MSLSVFNLCFICGLIYSEENAVELLHHLSRRDFAVSKKFEIALASALFKLRWNFCNSEMKASNDLERFFRLASAMSRHISGEPDAMRVVSRKPLAHKEDCCF